MPVKRKLPGIFVTTKLLNVFDTIQHSVDQRATLKIYLSIIVNSD